MILPLSDGLQSPYQTNFRQVHAIRHTFNNEKLPSKSKTITKLKTKHITLVATSRVLQDWLNTKISDARANNSRHGPAISKSHDGLAS